MADTASPAAVARATPKKATKKVASGPKKPKAKPTHPPTAIMVIEAVRTLKERGGSSFIAIKKYMVANYKADVDKLAPIIKKYLRSAVIAGNLIQTKGKGAGGSFKLPAYEKKVKVAAKKPKKAAGTTKKVAKPKKASVGAAKGAKKSGSIKKKTGTKEKKPKVAKKTTGVKKAAPKKAAAKK